VSGVLHGSVTRKQRGTLLDQILIDALLDMGRITYDDRKFFYPPRYYLTDHGCLNQKGNPLRLLSFKGQPKALSLDKRGHRVKVKATLDEWSNGIGAHLLRPEVLSVSDEPQRDHECDSPRSCGAERVLEGSDRKDET
jgi:hypothetical protein